MHFRPAEIRVAASGGYRGVWAAADLPEELRNHYDECNSSAPVGSALGIDVR